MGCVFPGRWYTLSAPFKGFVPAAHSAVIYRRPACHENETYPRRTLINHSLNRKLASRRPFLVERGSRAGPQPEPRLEGRRGRNRRCRRRDRHGKGPPPAEDNIRRALHEDEQPDLRLLVQAQPGKVFITGLRHKLA